mgnify:CR=1 FL=1
MQEQAIMEQPALVLSQAQREAYFRDGFLVLENYVPEVWLTKLRRAMIELIDNSRSLTQSTDAFVLEDKHSAVEPRLHRVTNPQDHHPVFWEFFTDRVMVDLAADVVGADVKFHHAKLNVKTGQGSSRFDWHQDIPGWPHTDFSPVTIGIYIEGCEADQGPLTLAEGTNRGPLHRMHDDAGTFVGIDPDVIAAIEKERLVESLGGPGTTVLLNCRVIHGSGINRSPKPRPLLLPVYSSADSFPYTAHPLPTPRSGEIVRGKAARFASFDTTPCPLPPDWSRKKSNPWSDKARGDLQKIKGAA